MSIKVYTDINKLNSESWDLDSENIFFIKYKFLKSFFNNHKNITHLFVLEKSNRLYGHIFNLNIKNIAHYSSNYLFKYFSNFIVGFLNIKFIYLTNSFITNTKSFQLNSVFILVKIKSSKDIFEGVNKVDKMAKVSIFQKYKSAKEGSFKEQQEYSAFESSMN